MMKNALERLERLDLGYSAAYAAYLSCVQSVSAACQRGERLTDELLRTEQTAFNDLVNARESLFDRLHRYGKPPHIGG